MRHIQNEKWVLYINHGRTYNQSLVLIRIAVCQLKKEEEEENSSN